MWRSSAEGGVGWWGLDSFFLFFYSFLHFGDSRRCVALADARGGLRGAPLPQLRYKCWGGGERERVLLQGAVAKGSASAERFWPSRSLAAPSRPAPLASALGLQSTSWGEGCLASPLAVGGRGERPLIALSSLPSPVPPFAPQLTHSPCMISSFTFCSSRRTSCSSSYGGGDTLKSHHWLLGGSFLNARPLICRTLAGIRTRVQRPSGTRSRGAATPPPTPTSSWAQGAT